MYTTYHQNERFCVQTSRIGDAVLLSTDTGETTYFQPGEDADHFLKLVSVVEEPNNSHADQIFETVCYQYINL